jgi:uncharacterized small protein (DUF1192 family)
MKERRKAGATHSFRLTQRASDIVDRLNHPRSLGGKSRQISDAIEYYFDTSKGVSIADLQEQIEIFVTDIERLEAKIAQQFSKNPEKRPKVPGWWRRFF